jgi:hypothetical protein
MSDEQHSIYGREPTFVLTLMHHGWPEEQAKVMVALGHVPPQEEVIDWFNSVDWFNSPPIPLMEVLFAAKLIEQRNGKDSTPNLGNWLR